MKKIAIMYLAVVMSLTFGLAPAPQADAVAGGITKCSFQGTASGTGIVRVTGTDNNSGKTKCAAYVKCDGTWPITDWYGYTGWATVFENGSIACGNFRKPVYQWMVFA